VSIGTAPVARTVGRNKLPTIQKGWRMENTAVHSRGFKEMRCSCGYFVSDGKKKLYRIPNQFGICEVHEQLAMFFKKNAPAEEIGSGSLHLPTTVCQNAADTKVGDE
jgi:hypothetical protein